MAWPPAGVIPVTVPGDVILTRRTGLAVWAGAVAAFPEGFELTVLIQFDVQTGSPPGPIIDTVQLHEAAVLSVGFCDGRYRSVTRMGLNRPAELSEGPHLTRVDGEADWSRGSVMDRWWVTPLPPPGPVELSVYLDAATEPSGTGQLDGAAIVRAASRAEVLWPKGGRKDIHPET